MSIAFDPIIQVAEHVPFPATACAQRMLESLLRDAVREASCRETEHASTVSFAGYKLSTLDRAVALGFHSGSV